MKIISTREINTQGGFKSYFLEWFSELLIHEIIKYYINLGSQLFLLLLG